MIKYIEIQIQVISTIFVLRRHYFGNPLRALLDTHQTPTFPMLSMHSHTSRPLFVPINRNKLYVNPHINCLLLQKKKKKFFACKTVFISPPSPGRQIMVRPKQLIFCALKARCILQDIRRG